MTSINLLDWRSKKIKIENNKLFAFIGLSVAFGVFIVVCFDMAQHMMIASKEDDIKYLNNETSLLESKISKIKGLQEQKELLLSRRSVIETLQSSRTLTVKIFDNMARVVPNGVVFNEMSRKGDELVISGVADSNSAVSVLMKNVQQLKWVKDAKLTEIKSAAAVGDNAKNSNQDSGAQSGGVSFQMKITAEATGGS